MIGTLGNVTNTLHAQNNNKNDEEQQNYQQPEYPTYQSYSRDGRQMSKDGRPEKESFADHLFGKFVSYINKKDDKDEGKKASKKRLESIDEESIDFRDSNYILAKNKELHQNIKKRGRPDLTAIKITSTLDAILAEDFIQLKTFFLFSLEFLKLVVFAGTIWTNMNSCALFSPSVLLLGGIVNFAQISVMCVRKLTRALYITTYNDLCDDVRYIVLRVASVVGLAIIEVLFITATFWYLNTMSNVMTAITSGLALLVVSNLDIFALNYVDLELIVFKTYREKFEEHQSLLEMGQIALVFILFCFFFSIAFCISISKHTTYDQDFCG